MIRELLNEDREQLTKLIRLDDAMSTESIAASLDGDYGVVYDDGEMKGWAGFKLLETEDGLTCRSLLYTAPGYRKQGVGRSLWQKLWSEIEERRPVRVEADYRSDAGHGRHFFAARGFKKWYSVELMGYAGGVQAESSFDIRPYEDAYYGDYIGISNDAFYELRRAYDFQPYCDEGLHDSERRRRMALERHNTFLLFDDGQPVAFARLKGERIEPVAVAPTHQGKGYGRALMQYCINRMLERGQTDIKLYVLERNQSARKLYESLGFYAIQQYECSVYSPRK